MMNVFESSYIPLQARLTLYRLTLHNLQQVCSLPLNQQKILIVPLAPQILAPYY